VLTLYDDAITFPNGVAVGGVRGDTTGGLVEGLRGTRRKRGGFVGVSEKPLPGFATGRVKQ
jgi:hypothetical protein